MFHLIIGMILIFGKPGFAKNIFSVPANSSIINGCSIFNLDGTHKQSFPGRFCLFLPDGSLVSYTEKTLVLINPDNSIRWEIPGNYPRHLNISPDGKRILTFRSAIEKSGDDFWRQDELLIIDLNGKILAQKKIGDLVKLTTSWALGMKDEIPAKIEKSHMNSIYEIPALVGKHAQELKEGYIVANCAYLGAFILTSDLNTIIKRFTVNDLRSPLVHDVQVTPEGKILYFANNIKVPSGLAASGVYIYDPMKKKISYSFKANPPEFFYSECCGSVQLIKDSHLFLAGFGGGGVFLDMKTGKVVNQFYSSFKNQSYQLAFLLKLVDVSDFLSKRKE